MKCCHQCAGLEQLFDERLAQNELRDYRRYGPDRTTRLLLDALKARGVRGLTLLDIGGGVGAIQHALLQAGIERATAVDASQAYLRAARSEAERLRHVDRIRYHHGDFVTLAPELESADIVTLDRVICCYPDAQALVGLSSARARRLYGLVFPRDFWWVRLFRPIFNSYFRLLRNPYRFFVHPTRAIDRLLAEQGFRRVFRRRGFFWQVVLYERR
jgi:magnesium-protoporphyrin O-methyltransferase